MFTNAITARKSGPITATANSSIAPDAPTNCRLRRSDGASMGERPMRCENANAPARTTAPARGGDVLCGAPAVAVRRDEPVCEAEDRAAEQDHAVPVDLLVRG